MLNFISSAIAAEGGQLHQQAGYSSFIMLAAFMAIFYFLLWRPQAKRAKDHRNLVSSIAVGDEVITSGGLIGKITKVDDSVISLTIADGVVVKVQKPAVTAALPKGSV